MFLTFSFFLFPFSFILPPAIASTLWQIVGAPAINFDYADAVAKSRIDQLNRRLAEIAAKLNPNQAWVVDILPLPKDTPPEQIKSVVIRLQGQPFIEVTEADALVSKATSVQDLANTWVRSLAGVFSRADIRQTLVAMSGLPPEISFAGTTYYLKPEIAPDRGLFRTDGRRADGKVVFREIPADHKVYQISGNNPYQLSGVSASPSTIFILNKNLQFVPYTKR